MLEQAESKRILQPAGGGQNWFGIDFNMNLYRGCCHGCIYCDSRSQCYQVENFDQVKVKRDCLAMLERELASKRKKGVVGIGAMSDSYNPYEKELQITRSALLLLERYGCGVSLETKGDLVKRDVDVLARISEKSGAIVKLTVTAAEDHLSRLIEPGAPVSSKRFAAVKALADEGIYTGVLMMPMLPHITANKENIQAIVSSAKENGASFIYPMIGVTLRDRQREHFFSMLNRNFPGLSQVYMAEFGNSYVCQASPEEELWETFQQECTRNGLVYRMKEIIAGYKSGKQDAWEEGEQISFF